MSFQRFFDAYLECAFWSTNDESDESGGEPLENNYSTEDIDEASLARLESEAREFYTANETLIDGDDSQAGHDFWLTRNGHGAGFWDGDWPAEVSDKLTDAANAYGSCDLYIGDDGQVYVF